MSFVLTKVAKKKVHKSKRVGEALHVQVVVSIGGDSFLICNS